MMQIFKKSLGSMLEKGIAVFVSIAFLATSLHLPQAKAEISQSLSVGYRSLADDLTAITLPQKIGKIQETYRGTSDKIVILIQDAHSIPDAQRSIRSAIDHFQTQYGISLVGLEGASEKLDPQIFKSFPDKELLRKTFDAYAQRGELTGGTAAALFNPSPSTYHGIEDWPLYEEGVSFFLKAMGKEKEVMALLDPMFVALTREKETAYSKELLEIDRLLASFSENKADLMQVLNQLSKYQLPPKGSELAVLLEEIQRDLISDAPIEIEIKRVAEQLASVLKSLPPSPGIRRELQEFYGKRQEFQTARMTPQAFALYLRGLVKEHKMRVKVSHKLAYLVENQKRLKDIEGTRLFEDFKHYADSVKESLFQNDRQRALDSQTQGLELINRFSRLELSFEDWGNVQKLISQLDQWTVTQDGVVSRDEILALLRKMEFHLAFYHVAEKRSNVLFKNILSLMEKQSEESSLLVAGGFHTEGLTQIFKAKGISYVLVMPRIGVIPGEPLYREHMQGQVSWSDYFEVQDGKVNLYDAFVRATRDKLLGDGNASAKGGVASSGKEWRDQIIRDLAAEGRITQASEYTRFIDETTHSSPANNQFLRQKWLTNIDCFGEGLKKLQIENNLSESSILQLIKTINIGTAAVAVEVGVLGPRAEIRAELLPSVENHRVVIAKAETSNRTEAPPSSSGPQASRSEARNQSRSEKVKEFMLDSQSRPEPTDVATLEWGDILSGAQLAFPNQNIQSRMKEIENSQMWAELGELLPFIDKFVRKICEDFSDRQILIFARDGEIFYDALKTILANNGEAMSRIRLVPLGETLMDRFKKQGFEAERGIVGDFLTQIGMSRENIQKGTKYLALDTGFRGSIANALPYLAWVIFDIDRDALENAMTNAVLATYDPNDGIEVFARMIEMYQLSQKDLERFFPRTYPRVSPTLKRYDSKYLTNITLAMVAQSLPRYQGEFAEVRKDDEKIRAVAVHSDINWNVDEVRQINPSIVNPLAAMMVQKRVTDYFKGRRLNARPFEISSQEATVSVTATPPDISSSPEHDRRAETRSEMRTDAGRRSAPEKARERWLVLLIPTFLLGLIIKFGPSSWEERTIELLGKKSVKVEYWTSSLPMVLLCQLAAGSIGKDPKGATQALNILMAHASHGSRGAESALRYLCDQLDPKNVFRILSFFNSMGTLGRGNGWEHVLYDMGRPKELLVQLQNLLFHENSFEAASILKAIFLGESRSENSTLFHTLDHRTMEALEFAATHGNKDAVGALAVLLGTDHLYRTVNQYEMRALLKKEALQGNKDAIRAFWMETVLHGWSPEERLEPELFNAIPDIVVQDVSENRGYDRLFFVVLRDKPLLFRALSRPVLNRFLSGQIPGLDKGVVVSGRLLHVDQLSEYILTHKKFAIPGYFENFIRMVNLMSAEKENFSKGQFLYDAQQAGIWSYESAKRMSFEEMLKHSSGHFAFHQISSSQDNDLLLSEAIFLARYLLPTQVLEGVNMDNAFMTAVRAGKVRPLKASSYLHFSIDSTVEYKREPFGFAYPVEVLMENQAYLFDPLSHKSDWPVRGFSRNVEDLSHRVPTEAGIFLAPLSRQTEVEALFDRMESQFEGWKRPDPEKIFYYDGETVEEGRKQLETRWKSVAHKDAPGNLVLSSEPRVIGEFRDPWGDTSVNLLSIKGYALTNGVTKYQEELLELTRYRHSLSVDGRELISVWDFSEALENLASETVQETGFILKRPSGDMAVPAVQDTGSSKRGTYQENPASHGFPKDFDLMVYLDHDLPNEKELQRFQSMFMEELIRRGMLKRALGDDSGLRLERAVNYQPSAGYVLTSFKIFKGSEKNSPLFSIDVVFYNNAENNDGPRYQAQFLRNMDLLLSRLPAEQIEEGRDYILSTIRTMKAVFMNEGVYKRFEGGLRGVGTEQIVMQLHGTTDELGTPVPVDSIEELKATFSVKNVMHRIYQAGFDENDHYIPLEEAKRNLVLWDIGALKETPKNLSNGISESGWQLLLGLATDYESINHKNVMSAPPGVGQGEARSELRIISDKETLKKVADPIAGALRPNSGVLLDRETIQQIEVIVVRGERDALIEILKQTVGEQMANAEASSKVSATAVKVSKEMAEVMVRRVMAILETNGIKGNLTIGFDISPDRNFMEALQAVKEGIGTAVFIKDKARKLDHKALEGVTIQTVGSLKSYKPLAAENAGAVPVLSQNLEAEYFSNEALFGVGLDTGEIQGEPFLEVAENVVRIVAGLLKANLMTKGVNPEEINSKLQAILFQLDAGSRHGVLSMNGRHLIVHREALQQIMLEYQARTEVRKAA